MAKGFSGGYGGRRMPMGGMNMDMMKQAQKMQQEMLKMQEEMESKEFSAAAGGGAVHATVSGKRELLSLRIDPEAVDPEETELLCDMVVAAVNEALRAAEQAANDGMSSLTKGMNLPF